jgi:superfamily I DNA/RNA helicase
LFGPPGTGKTTKVALDILTTLSYNHLSGNNTKILVLTPTNKAADVVVERVVELLSDEKKLEEVALTYYNEVSVKKLIAYCKNIFSTNQYQDILVRYGNSASPTLLQHNILKSKYTLKEIFPNLVLATTVHRLAFDEIVGNQLKDPTIGWTHIVIDEASMVSLPILFTPCCNFNRLQT